MKTLYDLELNECIFLEDLPMKKADEEISGVWVRRVPGGWLYRRGIPVFVPYSDEFLAGEMSK